MQSVYKTIEVLDQGYVKPIEIWGSDESFIEAARMSTQKGFLGWEKDQKLLAYLYKHKHMTPFEMGGLIIEVKAPIFVFREWHRHRTMSYNEMSARYIPLPNENYIPTLERLMLGPKNTTNKQAQSLVDLNENKVVAWLQLLETFYEQAQELYQTGLDIGIPKEVARISIPVGRYSIMRASANIRNWLAFLSLRKDAAAQWEIRQYANAVGEIIEAYFPRTYELFLEGFMNEQNSK